MPTRSTALPELLQGPYDKGLPDLPTVSPSPVEMSLALGAVRAPLLVEQARQASLAAQTAQRMTEAAARGTSSGAANLRHLKALHRSQVPVSPSIQVGGALFTLGLLQKMKAASERGDQESYDLHSSLLEGQRKLMLGLSVAEMIDAVPKALKTIPAAGSSAGRAAGAAAAKAALQRPAFSLGALIATGILSRLWEPDSVPEPPHLPPQDV